MRGGTRIGARKWPRFLLLNLVTEAGSLSSKEENDPMWPINVALMVSIYRSETAKIKSIDNYNMMLSAEKPSTVIVPKDVGEDEGDFD